MSIHIGANQGDIAPSILLPGDTLRAKYIAEKFFENPVCFNEVRGMLGYTGTYKGHRVSTMGTGMGIPSIGIYVNELITQFGCKNLIRVGTCGSFREDIGLMSIILAQGASTTSDFNRLVFKGTYCPIADFDLLRTAYKATLDQGLTPHVGTVLSSDMFYGEPDERMQLWPKYGVLGVEMESAALYTIAARERVRALTMLTVSDSKFTDRILSYEEKERSLDDMIRTALDTAIQF